MEKKTLIRPAYVKDHQSVDLSLGLATFVVSVFGNEDLGGDVVLPGAFKSAISSQPRLPKFAPNHDLSVEKKLGKVLAWREVGEGLEIDAQFNLDKQIAREVFSDFIFDPTGQEFSFSYDIGEGGAKVEKGKRYLSNIREVFDVGPVGIGMNTETRLVGVKEEEKAGARFSAETVSTFGGHLSIVEQAVAAMRQVLSSTEAQAPSEEPKGEGKTDEPIEAKVDDPDHDAIQKEWDALLGRKEVAT